MGTLLAIVLACGAFKDALFGGVIVANAVIGIVQELRAKRTLDKLAVLSAPKATIVRDGEVRDLAVDEIVLDDVLELRPGHAGGGRRRGARRRAARGRRVAAHRRVRPVTKEPGDELLSGSFVVAGSGRARVAKVGRRRLRRPAGRGGPPLHAGQAASCRRRSNKIITWVSWALVPTGAVLFW